MVQNDIDRAVWNIRQKLDGINAANASLSCLKQTMIEVQGARSTAERHWQTAKPLHGGTLDGESLDAGIARAEEFLVELANALKEDIAAWECEDLNGDAA